MANILGLITNRNKSKQISSNKSSSKNTTQGWIPVHDVNNGVMYRRDNHIVTGFNVQPDNISLKSEDERKKRITSIYEVLNGLDYYHQTLAIPRPVDLDDYISNLQNMKNEAESFSKKRLFDGYIRQAVQMATSGEVVERHYYILISHEIKKKNKNVLMEMREKIKDLAQDFTGAGLVSRVCSEQELRDLLFIFFNQQQSAYERAPQTSDNTIQLMYTGEL